MPWRRSAAFGLTCASIGVLGHLDVLGDHLTAAAWLVMVVAAIALTGYARLFADERLRAPWMTGTLIGAQVLIHLLCMVATMATSHGAMDMTALVPSGSMLAVHGVAVLAGLLVLLRLEQRAWHGVTRTVASVRRWLAVLPTRTAVALSVPRTPSPARSRHGFSLWFVRSAGRRGPPRLAAH